MDTVCSATYHMGMRVGVLTQLWRYPVKSMAGESLDAAMLTRRGIPGDRGWAVYDESRNGITGGKRLPVLRGCRARCASPPISGAPPPPAEITLPDGTRLLSDAPEAAPRLSALAGRPVTLRSLGPEGSESAPRLTMAAETPETIRELMGLAPGEPDADLSAFTPERLRELRQGNFFDAFPIHLLTRTTLRTLERVAPESNWDERRFRANLLVEADDSAGYPEIAWIGRRLLVGEAIIEVVMGCPRCVMVTQALDGVPQDHRVMRTLVKETSHIAGIYARVEQEGAMRVGSEIRLLS